MPICCTTATQDVSSSVGLTQEHSTCVSDPISYYRETVHSAPCSPGEYAQTESLASSPSGGQSFPPSNYHLLQSQLQNFNINSTTMNQGNGGWYSQPSVPYELVMDGSLSGVYNPVDSLFASHLPVGYAHNLMDNNGRISGFSSLNDRAALTESCLGADGSVNSDTASSLLGSANSYDSSVDPFMDIKMTVDPRDLAALQRLSYEQDLNIDAESEEALRRERL
ncbi:unnamed protein product [Soboliphyme baturini]|uniref:TORC_C domain-containing protein n=1 Tax=Soboliphyme baturini TaxID=241478 RepID=A0A183IF25_9BILA|nr:unnamed protein product [Soboliphyme baturini]